MVTMKNISKILGWIPDKKMILCYTFLLKVGNISARVVIHIYIAIDNPCHNSYQKQANENTVANARFFEKFYTANKPAKKSQVKKEEEISQSVKFNCGKLVKIFTPVFTVKV